MARILVGGAGGAPSNNFIRSLKESKRHDYLIGMSCVPTDLFLAETDEKHIVPAALDVNFRDRLLKLVERARPDFLHSQNDFEVRAVSRMRKEIEALGCRVFLPSPTTVETCVNKFSTYQAWATAGLTVPRTVLLQTPVDLERAFRELGEVVWLRAIEGGGGAGALPTKDPDFARYWIDRYAGWGTFTASELLTPKSVTWMSLWRNGELVVAQTRLRRSWNFGDRTLSGVTGITGVGETCSDAEVDSVAVQAIQSVDDAPHGIFSVDMTYDFAGRPNPTEINIGRFFTTHYFFTKAGLNFPEIYCNLALSDQKPEYEDVVNPLPDGLLWIRGMDREPVMTTAQELEMFIEGEQ